MRYRTTIWDIEPGTRLRRTRLHDRFGGNRQRGISPSVQSPNIFLFSRPSAGAHYGYTDDLEGVPVLYSGEGQKGNQELKAGNAAILKHRESGKTLRLFRVVDQEVEYLGAYEVDVQKPFHEVQAKQVGSTETRTVLQFRLYPLKESS